MTKLPFPIRIPQGAKLFVTQQFADKSNAAWYKANGVNLDAHNGVDVIVIGNNGERPDRATYGAALVCPVNNAERLSITFDSPMSTKGNGIKLVFWHEGQSFLINYWHCSEVVSKPTYKLGEEVGFIGNSGLVAPAPAINGVFNGAHLHFMCYVNGKLVNPLDYFDINKPFIGKDTGIEKDLPPFFWAIEKIRAMFSKKVNK